MYLGLQLQIWFVWGCFKFFMLLFSLGFNLKELFKLYTVSKSNLRKKARSEIFLPPHLFSCSPKGDYLNSLLIQCFICLSLLFHFFGGGNYFETSIRSLWFLPDLIICVSNKYQLERVETPRDSSHPVQSLVCSCIQKKSSSPASGLPSVQPFA